MTGWIYVQELKNNKALVRTMRADQIQQVAVEVKQISGKDTRRWSLIFKNGTLYELPDDATVLVRQTDKAFLELLDDIAKALKV